MLTTIQTFVDDEIEIIAKSRLEPSPHPWPEYDIRQSLLRALRRGMEMSLEVGPTPCSFIPNNRVCQLHKEHKCEGCTWYNDALSAYRADIQKLIDGL